MMIMINMHIKLGIMIFTINFYDLGKKILLNSTDFFFLIKLF